MPRSGERGVALSKMLRVFPWFTLKTSMVLTSISFRQATLPTERAPFVALRHFPRFIGKGCFMQGRLKNFPFVLSGKFALRRVGVSICLKSERFSPLSGASPLCRQKEVLSLGIRVLRG